MRFFFFWQFICPLITSKCSCRCRNVALTHQAIYCPSWKRSSLVLLQPGWTLWTGNGFRYQPSRRPSPQLFQRIQGRCHCSKWHIFVCYRVLNGIVDNFYHDSGFVHYSSCPTVDICNRYSHVRWLDLHDNILKLRWHTSYGYAFVKSHTITHSRLSLAPTPATVPMDHKITVGANGLLAYNPPNITASIGDTVTFEFHQKNHTVTQSNFLNPCEPLEASTGTAGFKSGL